MVMKKVLIPTKLDTVAANLLRENGAYTVVQDHSKDIAALAAEHPDAYALIVRSEKVTPAVMDAIPALRVVIRAGAGFDNIDTKHARRKRIDVMNTPGANANGVAEEVLALMLADARHLIAADASTRAGQWEKNKFMGRELAGKTVGIVGLGNIGRLVARRLSGFDCTLLGYDPVISSERARDANVRLTDLETLFSQSDYITLHIPENAETRGMVNAKILSTVKTGATIVNCARAGIIDEEALRAERARRSIHFLNDVYPKDAEGAKSVADIADIMLPHLGASTFEANENAARRAAEELIDFDEKGITSYVVNRDVPEGLDPAYAELANTLARLCHCLVGKRNKPRLLETSFYGSLKQFSDWLIVPIVAGIWEGFDRSRDAKAALTYLQEMGIDYVCRDPDETKGFSNSMTVDLTSEVDSDNLRKITIRGTIAEGVMMVSRINEFNKLYFEPVGPTVFFLYEDRPGVIGTIGGKLAAADVNIEDMRNPHDSQTNRSLAILKVNKPVSQEVIDDIQQSVNALAAFSIKL
jgi:D-3-phosphoglycerate dehydrogenase